MSTTYYQSSTASALSSSAGFNKALVATGSATTGTASLTAGTGSGQTGSFYLPPGVPGTSGVTGDYTVKLNLTTASTDASLSVTLCRINSSGAVQSSSSASATQSGSTAAVLTFSFASLDLGTWASGDRLRVDVTLSYGFTGSGPVTLTVGESANSAVTAPWGGPGAINGTASIVEASDTLAGVGDAASTGSMALVEAGDTVSASGTVPSTSTVNANGALIGAGDTASSSGTVFVSGSAALIASGDMLLVPASGGTPVTAPTPPAGWVNSTSSGVWHTPDATVATWVPSTPATGTWS